MWLLATETATAAVFANMVEATQFAAFVGALRGDTTTALADLKTYLSKSDDRRLALAAYPGWWYRPIAETPGFKKLLAN